jgi:hypothetical protein
MSEVETIAPSGATLADLDAKYVDHRTRAEREAAEAAAKKAVLGDLAALLLATPGLREIGLTGTTPSFNDGDPCYHSQSEYLNGRDPYGSTFPDDEEDEDEEGTRETGTGLPEEVQDATIGLLSAMAGELEAAFGTGWKIKVWKDGDAVKFSCDDHDEY